MSLHQAEVLVLGGGIAGAAVAAHLTPTTRVVLLEREDILARHATGRSAAMWLASYGAPVVRPLTLASRAFLDRPARGFGGPLLFPRSALHIARRARPGALEAFARQHTGLQALDPPAIARIAPILRPDRLAGGLLDCSAGDIDVDRLHQGYLRLTREHGGRLVLGATPIGLDRAGDHWRLRTTAGEFAAPTLVNATGAWADETALLAGEAPLGLTPLRRTVILVDPPSTPAHGQPIVKDIDERFYFRPFAGRLLITPADETPTPPCDAAPAEIDVARAVARFKRVSDHPVVAVRARWAGQRTFSPDRAPVIGWSRTTPGFFWLAGLGGTGIQTADATGRLASAMILGRPTPPDLVDHGVDPRAFAPGRL